MSVLSDVAASASELAACGEPISYYDVLLLVRTLPRVDELADPLLTALITLHDAPTCTDGARDILATFLQRHANRSAEERLRAQRTLTLADSGKRVRAKAGTRLRLCLPERRGAGWRWQVAGVTPGAECRCQSDPSTSPPMAEFHIDLQRIGRVFLTLTEQPPPARYASPGGRRFKLEIVIEP